MADAANLFDLAAKISVDTSRSDRALTDTQRKVLELAKEFSHLDNATKKTASGGVKDLDREFVRLAASSSGLRTSFVSLGAGISSVTAVFAGFIAGATAIAGVGAAIYGLAKSAMDTGGRLHDLAQQTNFSVETLSALGNAAETSGSSLEGISASLGIFQKHLEDASSGGVDASQILKNWNIDLNDNEKALDKVIKKLSEMRNPTQQTAYALALFGRSGKQLLGILKEAGGDLGEFKKQMADVGFTSDFAKKMDEAGDNVTRLGQNFNKLVADVGAEFVPAIDKIVLRLTDLIKNNREEIKQWGRDTAEAIDKFIAWGPAIQRVMEFMTPFLGMLHRAIDIYSQLSALAGQQDYPTIQVGPTADSQQYESVAAGTDPESRRLAALAKSIKQPRDTAGDKAGGAAKISAGQQLLNQLTEEYIRLQAKTNDWTKVQIVNEELKNDKYKNLSPTLRQLITDTANYIAIDTAELEATEKKKKALEGVSDLIKEQTTAIREAARGENEWDRKIRALHDSLSESGAKIKQRDYNIIVHNDHMLEFLRLTEKSRKNIGQLTSDIDIETESMRKWLDAMAPAIALMKKWTENHLVVPLDQLPDSPAPPKIIDNEKFKQQIEALAGDLTNILDRSIYEGFTHGIKAGFAELTLGLLDIIKNVFLKQLETGLATLLSNALGGGKGGGSWWQTLLGIGMSAAGAGAGSIGGGGGAAAGGMGTGFAAGFGKSMGAGGLKSGGVLPSQAGGKMAGHTFVVNLNVPNAAAAGSQATQHQVAKQMHALMAKTVLTG